MSNDKGAGQLVSTDGGVLRHEPSQALIQAKADGNNLMSVISTAVTGGKIDATTLAKLYEMRNQELARIARMEFVDAMARFKEDPPKIVKDKRVHFPSKNGGATTDYMHATLPNVVAAVIEKLASVGISHRWENKVADGKAQVTCILTHTGGHEERTEFPPISPDNTGNKNAIQAVQSAITYAQRYTLLSALGLSAGDDDDGQSAGGPRLPDGGNISESQEADLRALIQENNGDLSKLLKHWKVESLADIPVANFNFCCQFVRDMAKVKSARQGGKVSR